MIWVKFLFKSTVKYGVAQVVLKMEKVILFAMKFLVIMAERYDYGDVFFEKSECSKSLSFVEERLS